MSQATQVAHPLDVPRTLRRAVLALAVVALALAVAVRLNAPTSRAQALVGHAAPAFALPAEVNGSRLPGTISLPAHSGHPLLLVFAYSLCPQCLNEIQTARDLQARGASRGLGALYIDSPGETPAIANAYFQRLGVIAPILLDGQGAVAARYGIGYYPTIILIDAHGSVRYVASGEASSANLSRALDALLASGR